MIIKIENKEIQETIKREFIDYLPWRLEWAVNEGMGSDIKNIVNYLDYFDFHYRKFLIGQAKNLGRCNHELRQFYNKHPQSIGLVIEFLDLMEPELLKMELYEIMNKFIKSRAKIKNYINKMTAESAPF